MRFVKMQGLGNDYIYVDCMKEKIENPAELSIKISDRHFGVGSDGLILVGKSEIADYTMNIYNADGSQAEMCGNGIRCVGKFLHDEGYVTGDSVDIETLAGIKHLDLIVKDGVCVGASVDMGEPILTPSKVPVVFDGDKMINEEVTVNGKSYKVTAVSMGNPHAVIFQDEKVEDMDLESIGPFFESHEIFPARTNTEFVNVIDRKTLRMRVWERGSAETMACGTGASAVAVAGILNGLCDREVTVKLNGGNLKITWKDDNHVIMEGPAVRVCTGEYL
ncbi:MAG: diaminopimelate epimerase [Clostridia bacterium]|nr:diaminopimelate epimerase [Clostridia bacterium]